MKYYICKKIGDGLTPETAFRPSIVTEVGKVHFGSCQLDNDNFLVAVDDDVVPTKDDIEVTPGKTSDIATKLGVAINPVASSSELLQKICETKMSSKVGDNDVYIRGIKVGDKSAWR